MFFKVRNLILFLKVLKAYYLERSPSHILVFPQSAELEGPTASPVVGAPGPQTWKRRAGARVSLWEAGSTPRGTLCSPSPTSRPPHRSGDRRGRDGKGKDAALSCCVAHRAGGYCSHVPGRRHWKAHVGPRRCTPRTGLLSFL